MFERIVQIKRNGKYETTYTTEHKTIVLENLSHELIAKKLHKCQYIARIQRRNLYDGHEEIKIYYSNGNRAIYTIEF